MNSVFSNRLAGCIIGQCLGDALGFPVEGCNGYTCRDYIDKHVSVWASDAGYISPNWTGQYTDDSQLARELLISLIRNDGWCAEDYARRIAEIFRTNRIVGRGIATDNAAGRLMEGIGWQQSGEPAPSAGNGTAMRAAAVGMYFHNDLNRLVSVAHEQGWITHHDGRCSAGSVAIAGAVALAITEDEIRPAEFASTLREWTAPFSEDFANLIGQLGKWVEMRPSEALQYIAAAGKTEGYRELWPGISPYVIPSVLWSLYSFLTSPEDYMGAVTTAIGVGGDVDTTAAMTGAISGGYLGLSRIPGHLAKVVNDHGEWGYSEMVGLANECYDKTIRDSQSQSTSG